MEQGTGDKGHLAKQASAERQQGRFKGSCSLQPANPMVELSLGKAALIWIMYVDSSELQGMPYIKNISQTLN